MPSSTPIGGGGGSITSPGAKAGVVLVSVPQAGGPLGFSAMLPTGSRAGPGRGQGSNLGLLGPEFPGKVLRRRWQNESSEAASCSRRVASEAWTEMAKPYDG